MTSVSTLPMNPTASNTINALFKCYADIERIGDHCQSIFCNTLKNEKERLQDVGVIREEPDAAGGAGWNKASSCCNTNLV